MAGHVEPERLLLEREQLLGAPLLDLGIRLALRRRRAGRLRRRLHEPEQRRLPAAPIALLGGATLERRIECREQLRAVILAQTVERAGLDQLLDDAAVALLRVDAATD